MQTEGEFTQLVHPTSQSTQCSCARIWSARQPHSPCVRVRLAWQPWQRLSCVQLVQTGGQFRQRAVLRKKVIGHGHIEPVSRKLSWHDWQLLTLVEQVRHPIAHLSHWLPTSAVPGTQEQPPVAVSTNPVEQLRQMGEEHCTQNRVQTRQVPLPALA